MDRTAGKRVLLIGGDQRFRQAFGEALAAAGETGAYRTVPAETSGPERAAGARQPGWAGLSIETADDLQAALARIAAAGAWPYLLAVIHPVLEGAIAGEALPHAGQNAAAHDSTAGNGQAESAGALAEVVARLCEADEELPLLVCLPDARRNELAQMPADRVLWLRLPLEADEVRRLVAAQIDRRLVRLQTRHELKSMQQTIERFKERAAAADRARSEMLANVSHELRTPLNAIVGFSRLLLKEPLESSQREKLDYVYQAAAALREQVERLLDFARLTAGQIELCRAPFRLDQVIQAVLSHAQPKAEAKGLAVYCHVSESVPPWLCGDRRRLGQLLGNLLDNAIKFTVQGAVHVQVVLDELTAEAATLRITVSDTGVGIPPDRQAQIFASFAQADGSSTRRFGGLGLGLAICKELVDLMGGQIGFRSAAGQGSSFWVCLTLPKAGAEGRGIAQPGKSGLARLPSQLEAQVGAAPLPDEAPQLGAARLAGEAQLGEAGLAGELQLGEAGLGGELQLGAAPLPDEAPLPEETGLPDAARLLGEVRPCVEARRVAEACPPGEVLDEPAAAMLGETLWLGNARVLVAQPDQFSRSIAELLFSRAGCLVDLAATPREALGGLSEASYDVVLIDAEMLGPGGPGALADFRRREAACGRRAMVVVWLPDGRPAAQSQWRSAGADRCAIKPCSVEALLELIDYCAREGQAFGRGRSGACATAGCAAPASVAQLDQAALAALTREFQQGNWGALDAAAGKMREQFLQAGCWGLADAALRVQLAARSEARQRAAAALGILQDAWEQHASAHNQQNASVPALP